MATFRLFRLRGVTTCIRCASGLTRPKGLKVQWALCCTVSGSRRYGFGTRKLHKIYGSLVFWRFVPYIGNNHPNWLIFFRGVETTNQMGKPLNPRIYMDLSSGSLWKDVPRCFDFSTSLPAPPLANSHHWALMPPTSIELPSKCTSYCTCWSALPKNMRNPS